MMDIEFETDFKNAYQRNRNSRTKTKNLRCFPGCAHGKHEQFGFCGHSITAVARLDPASELAPDTLFAVAQFTLKDSVQVDHVATNTVPTEKDLRTKRSPTKKWIRVKTQLVQAEGAQKLVFQVNPDLVGWHYDWKSSKKDRKKRHCLELYVFKKNTVLGGMDLLLTGQTPSFLLYSGNQVPDEPGSPRALKRRRGSPIDIPPIKGEPGLQVLGAVAAAEDIEVRKKEPSEVNEETNKVRNILVGAKELLEHQRVERMRRMRSASGSVVTDDDYNTLAFTEEEASKMFDELLKSSNADMMNMDEEELGPAETKKLLDGAMLQEIVNIVSSDDLIQEINGFINACTTGPLGSALCDVLDKLDSNREMNPFIKEFSKSLFLRFQNIIAQKIEADLSTNALVQLPEDNRKGSGNGPKQLIYDVHDDNKIYEFLKLIKYRSRTPHLREQLTAERKGTTNSQQDIQISSTPYESINRVWNQSNRDYETWWLNTGCESYGVMNDLQAKYLGKMYRSLAIFVTENLVTWQGDKEFGNIAFSIIPDGKVHDLDKISFLMDYVELSKKKYIGYHFVSPDGTYFMDYCLWYTREVKGEPSVIYYYSAFNCKKGATSLNITRKLMVTDAHLPPEIVLPNCRSVSPKFLLAEEKFLYHADTS